MLHLEITIKDVDESSNNAGLKPSKGAIPHETDELATETGTKAEFKPADTDADGTRKTMIDGWVVTGNFWQQYLGISCYSLVTDYIWGSGCHTH